MMMQIYLNITLIVEMKPKSQEVAQNLDLPDHRHDLPLIQVQGLGPDPVQDHLPVPDQDLVLVPESDLGLKGLNQGPALGPLEVRLHQERDPTQAPIHHHPQREERSEVYLDPLPRVNGKSDGQDLGRLKDNADHRLDPLILIPYLQVLKRNNIFENCF